MTRRTLLAVAVAGVAVLATSCTSGKPGGSSADTQVTTASPSAPAPDSLASSTPTSTPTPTPTPTPTVATTSVHVSAYPGDGSVVGVGMPLIATFDHRITSALLFAKDATVTVNGQPAGGAWYFEYSDPASGHVMEAHYRPQDYWPAHAKIHVTFALKGVSAGPGLAFDGALTSLDYSTGARNVGIVSDATHTLTIYTDGVKYGVFPVSLGARNTPTARGTKVIMEQGRVVRMVGPGYDDCCVQYTQRLTYGGEYLHSAPWNIANIGHYDSSNGCTNLLPADAKRLFTYLRVGDVVEYPDANGPQMRLGDGYGDWNVAWPTWQTGGVLRTQ